MEKVENARAAARRASGGRGIITGKSRRDSPISPVWPFEPFQNMEPEFPVPDEESDSEDDPSPDPDPRAQVHTGGPSRQPRPLPPLPPRSLPTEAEAPELRTQAHRLSAILDSHISQADLDSLKALGRSESEDREEALMEGALAQVNADFVEAEEEILAKVLSVAEDGDDIEFMVDCIMASDDAFIDSCIDNEDSLDIVGKKVESLRRTAEFMDEQGLIQNQKEAVKKEIEKRKQAKATTLMMEWAEKIEEENADDPKGKGKAKATY